MLYCNGNGRGGFIKNKVFKLKLMIKAHNYNNLKNEIIINPYKNERYDN